MLSTSTPKQSPSRTLSQGRAENLFLPKLLTLRWRSLLLKLAPVPNSRLQDLYTKV